MGLSAPGFPAVRICRRKYQICCRSKVWEKNMVLFLLLLISKADAHGSLVLPPPWSDDGGQIGMRPPLHCAATFSTCLWFTNFTRIPGAPTLDPQLWTYSKQFYYEAGLPKLHQKHNCEETEANYLDWREWEEAALRKNHRTTRFLNSLTSSAT